MYSYTVDWKRVVLMPILLGLLGASMLFAGLLWQLLPVVIGGCIVLCFALYLYIHRTWEKGDFISLTDTYLLICRRKKEYIFHASDIKEIVYGDHIKLKIQERWFNLNWFVQCKQFQNMLVQFAVHNGIFVHASNSKGQRHGKYSRIRVERR